MKEIEQSQTTTIKRSSINFQPKNIKAHTDEEVRKQRDNIKKRGFLGGVVWNEMTFNLVDGHRRVQALDLIHKYDPNDPSTDYEIKVEKVSFNETEELEQMSFMALANTKADYNLLASIIDELDYKNIGISESDYNDILSLKDVDIDIPLEEFVMPKGAGKAEVSEQPEPMLGNKDNVITEPRAAEPVREMSEHQLLGETEESVTEAPEDDADIKKELTKINKQYTQDVAERRNTPLSLIGAIKFKDEEEKAEFCYMFGLDDAFNITIEASTILNIMKQWENQQK